MVKIFLWLHHNIHERAREVVGGKGILELEESAVNNKIWLQAYRWSKEMNLALEES